MNLQNLTFMVSLLDKVSGPAGAMMKTMDTVTNRIQSGYRKIGYGVAGVAGAGYALDNILEPTKQMQQALGEVKSLDVTDDVLSNLTKTALKFSLQYGESAVDFVRSSYEIKGAIDGLAGDELPKFTYAAAVLAKGTKANVGDITNYIGTMYSIFKDSADKMGKSQWVEQLTGQTALAVKLFKTDGVGISQAFTTLGANAESAKRPIEEQFGVLGKLLGAMPGGEAGTKYKAFLKGVGGAQEKLGLNFTDSFGHMLPMVEILSKIKGKYNDLGNVKTSDLISKAFGSDEAKDLIVLLAKDITGLNDSITQLGNQKGMQNAIEMAKKMTMEWDRAEQGINALKITLGMQLLPTINKFLDKINEASLTMLKWSDQFPELTHLIGQVVLGIFGVIAAAGLLSIVAGVWALIVSPIFGVVVGISLISYALYGLLDAWAQWAYGMSIFDTMKAGYEAAKLSVTDMIDTTISAFTSLKSWLSNFNLWEFLLSGVDALIGKMNMIPGVNIDMGGAKAIAAPAGISGNSGNNGGLMQKYGTMNNQNQSRSIGTVVINNNESKKTLAQMVDEVSMAGG